MNKSTVFIKDISQDVSVQDQLNKKAAQKQFLLSVSPYFGLIFIFLLFSIVTKGRFLSLTNIENLINQCFGLVIIAIGSVFVYAHGGKDMSIGAVSGVGQLVCAVLLLQGYPVWLAMGGCILVTMLASSITAGISIGFGVPVFIGSMCVRTSFNGILQFVTTKGEVIADYQKYAYMNNPTLKGLIILCFAFLGMYLFNYTVFGKYNKAIGGNPVTATQAGIQNKKNILFAFLFMGMCVGVSAIFSFFRIGKVTGITGSGTEFNTMIAMALGGVPMTGGDKTKLSSAIIGAVTITVLVNGLQVWGLNQSIIDLIQGILFVIIIALSYDRSEGRLVV